MNELESYCTFRIGDLHFGVMVRQVQEVIRYQEMTSVALAPSVIKGLMNLRGQIVPALDLRERLNLPAPEQEVESMNVVVRTSDEPVSLLVDEIGDVVEADSNLFEFPPETLQGIQRDLIRGAYKLNGQLLLILDTERVVEIAA